MYDCGLTLFPLLQDTSDDEINSIFLSGEVPEWGIKRCHVIHSKLSDVSNSYQKHSLPTVGQTSVCLQAGGQALRYLIPCDCGLGGSCQLDSSGDKICYCFSGYARYKGHCYECDCGPYGTCILESGIARCTCDVNYAEKNGKCEYKGTSSEGTTD
ncbi:hypothetical protein AVEN_55482-1 [Araneus ventricosus]|uniref:EGF-like domain-containing protein n=1 Tax=Araneus ventricosus TaxID=182803 RepID=A0A4Y2TG99_ARAVE|nr:hypothetical protein AVEN_55482-1 [Araneus ventricosus]